MVSIRPPPRDGGGEVPRLVGSAAAASVSVWVSREGTQPVVWLRGEQDLSTAVFVADALAKATAAGDGDVVVDLSRVEFIDARTVTALVHGRNLLRSRSRDLILRAPSSPARRILQLCGLLGRVNGRLRPGHRPPVTSV